MTLSGSQKCTGIPRSLSALRRTSSAQSASLVSLRSAASSSAKSCGYCCLRNAISSNAAGADLSSFAIATSLVTGAMHDDTTRLPVKPGGLHIAGGRGTFPRSPFQGVRMEEILISTDIETTGPAPGRDLYSMYQLGSCVVGDPSLTFYAEIALISDRFIPEALMA